jgi:hypothetical protein
MNSTVLGKNKLFRKNWFSQNITKIFKACCLVDIMLGLYSANTYVKN